MINGIGDQILTITDYENHLRYDRRMVETTIHNYLTYIKNFETFINKKPWEATREDIRSFIKSLEISGKGKATISNYIIAFRGYFNWLADITEDKNIIAISFFVNKIIRIKRPKNLVAFPTLDEVNRLRLTIEAHKKASSYNKKSKIYKETVRDKAIIELLITTGLRSNELRNLKLNDIDLENKILLVKVGKGDKQRVSLFNDRSREAIIDFLDINDITEDQILFPFKQGNIINYIIQKWMKRANIEKRLHAHSFRHFFITESHRQGIPIESVADHVGHVNLNTTKGYIRFSVEDLKEKYKKFTI